MIETTKTEVIPEFLPEAAPEVESNWRQFVSDFAENKVAVGALIVFIGIVFVALFAPLISPQNPYDLAEIDILNNRLPPRSQNMSGTTYWLGTDGYFLRAAH